MTVISLFFGSVTMYGWILLGCMYVTGIILIHINDSLVNDLRSMDGILGIIFSAFIVIFWPISFILVLGGGFVVNVLESFKAGIGKILGRFRKLTDD